MGKKNKGKKGKPLTGLAAALVKSGHLSETKAKKLVREQRREERGLDPAERAQREAERRERLAAERAAETAAARERERERLTAEALARARRIVRAGGTTSPGPRRWYFVARDGRILFLDVSDDTAALLASGGAGIVEALEEGPEEHLILIGARDLESLRAIDPEAVRFWNRGTP